MSKEDLSPKEIDDLPHRAIMYDVDNDPLHKLSQGWIYRALMPKTFEEQESLSSSFFIRRPQAYPPYSLQKKAEVQ